MCFTSWQNSPKNIQNQSKISISGRFPTKNYSTVKHVSEISIFGGFSTKFWQKNSLKYFQRIKTPAEKIKKWKKKIKNQSSHSPWSPRLAQAEPTCGPTSHPSYEAHWPARSLLANPHVSLFHLLARRPFSDLPCKTHPATRSASSKIRTPTLWLDLMLPAILLCYLCQIV